MPGVDQPGLIRGLWSVGRSLITIRKPRYGGTRTVDHSDFGSILAELARSDETDLYQHVAGLKSYMGLFTDVDQSQLSRDEALAFWINLYNAGALALAGEAQRRGKTSVLRVPGAFSGPIAVVDGETLSLDAIEHAKIRRFKDPRIHSALVCGSVSCPTLRSAPFDGHDLDSQLEQQMASFMANGGARLRGDGTLELSRVFLWYGADFARPERMPTIIPVTKSRLVDAISAWIPAPPAAVTNVVFQSYDWGLRCSVGTP